MVWTHACPAVACQPVAHYRTHFAHAPARLETHASKQKDDIPTSSAERSIYFVKQLSSCRVHLKSLYAILIRCTLALDMRASTV